MGLRAQRVPRPDGGFVKAVPVEIESTTKLHPYRFAGDRDASTAIGQYLAEGVHKHYQETGPATGTLWLLDPTSRSWASVGLEPSPPYPVSQGGPRRLFDEVAAAHRRWIDAGGPGVDRWLITAGPDWQHIELADADRPYYGDIWAR